MAKSRRDRLNFYVKSLSNEGHKYFGETVNARRDKAARENGRLKSFPQTLPLDIKHEIAKNPDVIYNRVSQNQRKQVAFLKKRRARIERSRNERVIEKEIQRGINEGIEDHNEFMKLMDNMFGDY